MTTPDTLPETEPRCWRIRLYDGRKYRKGMEHLALPDTFRTVTTLDFQQAREAAELAANDGDTSRERMWHFSCDTGEDLTEPAIAALVVPTYIASIEDQPDGWDVVASSMDEAIEEANSDIWANEADPVGTRFTVREYEAGVLVDCREGVVLA